MSLFLARTYNREPYPPSKRQKVNDKHSIKRIFDIS